MRKGYQLLLNELVLVNAHDRYVGPIPKWDAHQNVYLRKP